MGCGRVGCVAGRWPGPDRPRGRRRRPGPHLVPPVGHRISRGRVLGMGFDRDVLLRAGIERADAFAAVSSGDNSNIISARVARETFGVERVVARIYDAKRAAVYERLGIPTVATVPWTTDRLLNALSQETETTNGVIPPAPSRVARARAARGLVRTPVARSGGRRPDPRRVPDPVRHRRAAGAASTVDPGRRPGVRRRGVAGPWARRGHRGAASRGERPPEEGTEMKVAIAGAGAVGPLHRTRAAAHRPRGDAARTPGGRTSTPTRSPRRTGACRRLRTDACSSRPNSRPTTW